MQLDLSNIFTCTLIMNIIYITSIKPHNKIISTGVNMLTLCIVIVFKGQTNKLNVSLMSKDKPLSLMSKINKQDGTDVNYMRGIT